MSLTPTGVLLSWIVRQLVKIGCVLPPQPIVLGWSVGSFALAGRVE